VGNGGKGGGTGEVDGGNGTGGAFITPDGGAGADAAVSDGSCGASVIEASPKEVSVLLVIDQSDSMSKSLGASDRWTATKGALGTAIDGTKDAIDFGLDLFPSAGCDVPADPVLAVPVEPGTTGVPKILAALEAAGPVPQGGTPTAAALARALEYFETGPGLSLAGDRYVLLATDGGPNCNSSHAPCAVTACVPNMEPGVCPIEPDSCCDGDVKNCLDDVATTRRVEALATAGVPTFVVGIPGTEDFADTLNAVAVAGGRPRAGDTKYYAVTNAAELTDTFRTITRDLVKTCELQLQDRPPNNNALNVQIDGEFIPQAGADGWELDLTTTPPTVVLKGATCAAIEAQGASSVTIVYGCPTIR